MTDQLQAVLLGGALTLVGLLVAELRSLVVDRRQREERTMIHRREKYEEFSGVFTETLGWITHFGQSRSVQDVCSRPPPASTRRLITLATLYFPTLVDPTIEFANGLTIYYGWAIDNYRPGPSSIGAQINSAPDYEVQSKRLRQLKAALDAAITDNAPKYVRA
jgi:hypothetical protein